MNKIENLVLSVRAKNCIDKAGILTVSELAARKNLSHELKGGGVKTVRELAAQCVHNGAIPEFLDGLKLDVVFDVDELEWKELAGPYRRSDKSERRMLEIAIAQLNGPFLVKQEGDILTLYRSAIGWLEVPQEEVESI